MWCNLTGRSLSKMTIIIFQIWLSNFIIQIEFVRILHLKSFQISVHISCFNFALQHVSQLHNQQGQDAQVYTLKYTESAQI